MKSYIIKNAILKYSIGIATLAIACLVSILPHASEAATLYMRPSASSVSVGDIVSVRFLVNTDGKHINTTDAVVNFPTDMFEVVSTSKSNSIFSLWVDGPRFSNPEGKIVFDGGLPTPGYAGASGEVAAVTLKAKKAGTATLIFSSASIRENDGMGTDILTSKPSATIQITAQKVVTEPAADKPQANDSKPEEKKKLPIVTRATVPEKPEISSATHPDPASWYKGTTASFKWNIPSDVVSIQASLDSSSLDNPTASYDGSVSSKTLSNLDDGVYYFNLRFKNSIGKGPAAHYKVQVDNTAPELEVPIVREEDGRNILLISAADPMSGISYYDVQIDSQQMIRITPDDLVEGEYLLNPQTKGMHMITVYAADKAGNISEEKISFDSPGITPPQISASDKRLELGNDISVHGTSQYPNTTIRVTFAFENGKTMTVDQKTDADGAFDAVLKDVSVRGALKVAGIVVFANDISSGPSNELVLHVGQPKILETFAVFAYPVLAIVFVVFLASILIFLIYLGWFKFFGLRSRLKMGVREIARNTHRTLDLIKRELLVQLSELKRIQQDRNLTDAEQKIFDDILKQIDDVEAFIQEEIAHLV